MAKKVLIIDDSAVVRQTLADIMSSDRRLSVIGTAQDPFYAVKKIAEEKPDVITLDVEMPRMDGLTFLRKLMSQAPIPVVVISSLVGEGALTAITALESGAVDVLEKPRLAVKSFLEEGALRICDAVVAAANARVRRQNIAFTADPKYSADAVLARKTGHLLQTTEKVVAVGASTGGTEALLTFLSAFPPDCPGIVVVQHMPEGFTRSFALRLNQLCAISVKEAENNDTVMRGQALIAPGNKHLVLKRSGAKYMVQITDGPLVNRHRPSVDVLFRSVAQVAGPNSIGIIMTGMGDDGARGLLEMKQAGAYTIAQDEKTSVVFGMPNEAVKLNAHTQVLPLQSIAGQVLLKADR